MIVKMIVKLIPRKVFFTSGVGTHPEYLDHLKLHRDAGIKKFNLVTVEGSILPPKCEIVS
jgi:arginine decarboxylase